MHYLLKPDKAKPDSAGACNKRNLNLGWSQVDSQINRRCATSA
jgi:hypothetical protein